MLAVFKGSERIGSLLKVVPSSRPWYAYAAADGRGENFKTRKEAVAWLGSQHDRSRLDFSTAGTSHIQQAREALALPRADTSQHQSAPPPLSSLPSGESGPPVMATVGGADTTLAMTRPASGDAT